jgi:hypothetical protein
VADDEKLAKPRRPEKPRRLTETRRGRRPGGDKEDIGVLKCCDRVG